VPQPPIEPAVVALAAAAVEPITPHPAPAEPSPAPPVEPIQAPTPLAARGGASERRPVYIVDGSRTPFIKARGKPGPFTPVDLAVQCGRPLLLRQPFAPDAFDQVILGCVNVIADEMNPARVAALRLGMGEAMTAFTVQINCGSGMQSIDTAYRYIREGVSDLILAGGAESLSHAPLVFSRAAVNWYAKLFAARDIGAKARAMLGVRPAFFTPVIGLEEGLTDPITDLNMGQTAELVAHLFHITRRQADEYAAESQHRLAAAQKNGYFSGEIELAFAGDGTAYNHDDGVRPDSSADSLAKLKPAFERPWGKVTAGNSSQITDGASWTILASEDAVKEHGLTPKAVIVDSEWSALDPSVMGLGPVYCSTAILKRHGLALGDIELWELNEAFAAQVLGCLAAWEDAEFCRDALGLDAPAGSIPRDRLNVDGGAIGVGHPVGASGNRIVLHLVNAMKRLGYKRGIATECIGGGQGGAMLIEAI
jgi:acetyl-CoA C-acetyltransferase